MRYHWPVTYKDKEKERVTKRAWRRANPDKALTKERIWQQANKEKVRASKLAWQRAHPERLRERELKWKRAHPEQTRINRRAWLARQTSKLGNYYVRQILKKLTHIPASLIPNSLIAAKREHLKVLRLLKEQAR